MGQLKQLRYEVNATALAAHIFDMEDKVMKNSLQSFFVAHVGFNKYPIIHFYDSTVAYLLEHGLAVELR